ARRTPLQRRASGSRRARQSARRAVHRLAPRRTHHGHRAIPRDQPPPAAPTRHAGSLVRLAGGDGGQGRDLRRANRRGSGDACAPTGWSVQGLGDVRRQPSSQLCVSGRRDSSLETRCVTTETPQLTLRPPLPRSLYIETTSRCNSKCQTCILTFGGREPAEDLTWVRFRHIVDQFPALERVLLHGIGEPLLNRDLPRMVAHLHRRGAIVLFNSNAISLSVARADALIAAGLDELRVSLDASTAASYARVRGADA